MQRSLPIRWELAGLRWLLVAAIGYWAVNQLASAYEVLVVTFGDAVSAGIDPTLIIIVDNMGPIAALLTIANATAYTATVALLLFRFSLALPVYAAALAFDLTGWIIYSTQSVYDHWAESTYQLSDWVANGLLLVCLIGVIILRQTGGLPRRIRPPA